jgi:hypothetical protein
MQESAMAASQRRGSDLELSLTVGSWNCSWAYDLFFSPFRWFIDLSILSMRFVQLNVVTRLAKVAVIRLAVPLNTECPPVRLWIIRCSEIYWLATLVHWFPWRLEGNYEWTHQLFMAVFKCMFLFTNMIMSTDTFQVQVDQRWKNYKWPSRASRHNLA